MREVVMLHLEFHYRNGRTKNFDDLDSFCAAIARKRTAEAMVWAYTRLGSSIGRSVDTPEEARLAIAEIERELFEIQLAERRPHLWAELRPEAMAAHMARRPRGYRRWAWAETLTDRSIDSERTVDEQSHEISVAQPARMETHMAARPAGHPRPDWRRQIVDEPPGGYDAYERLVLNAR